MNLIILAGFLGSGKTTVLLAIARALAEHGLKVAVIENEVGKIGIDDKVLAEEGITNLRQLFSGCVCCQLRVDLLTTLYDLEKTCNPDVVILEPSGVAAPGPVRDTFLGYGGNLESKQTIVLVDALRHHSIEILSLPFITAGIEAADLVLINKIDQIPSEQLTVLQNSIRERNGNVPLLPISALLGTNIDLLLPILRKNFSTIKDDPKPHSAEDPNKPVPTVHAREFNLSFTNPVSSTDLTQHISLLIHRLAADLQAAGCQFIGHIKAILRPEKGGYLLFNLTTFDQDPVCKGGIAKTITQATLTLNAIVYGVDQFTLYEKVSSHFDQFLP